MNKVEEIKKLEDLEKRIDRLESIEAIRYLQAKYQRCLDERCFDELASCFTIDAVSSYGNDTMNYQGKDAIIKFLCSVMTLKMPSCHLIHGGEIDILDEENAEAKWYLEDFLLHKTYKMKLHGTAIYHVKYRKENGKWLISSIGYKRGFEYMEARGLINLCTLKKTTFLDQRKKEAKEDLGEYGKYFYEYEIEKKRKN